MNHVRFLPDSPLAVTSSLDRLVRVWDVRTGSCVKELHGHADSIMDIDVSSYVSRFPPFLRVLLLICLLDLQGWTVCRNRVRRRYMCNLQVVINSKSISV